MHTNEATCIINGLKFELIIINQEHISNSLTSQFDAVQVIINFTTNRS